MKKELLTLGLTAVMTVSMAACGEEEKPAAAAPTEAVQVTESATPTEVPEEPPEEEPTEAAEPEKPEFSLPDRIVFDDKFEIQVVGYEYFDSGDSYDYDFLNVYYDYTPLNDRFYTCNAIYWTASQSGTEQKNNPSSNLTFGNAEHTDDIWLHIQQGVTFRGMMQFSVNKGDTSVITVGVGEKSDEYVFFDVDPTWEMPDIRHEAFEIAKVPSPSYGPGNMPQVTGEDFGIKYDLKINGITEYSSVMELDADKKPVYYTCVGISYTITNHSGKEDSPFMLFSSNNYIFQDGVSIKDTTPGKESVDYGKTQKDLPLYQKIQDGQTVDFVQYYRLRSDSPIEWVHRDFRGTLMGDMVYEVEPLDLN